MIKMYWFPLKMFILISLSLAQGHSLLTDDTEKLKIDKGTKEKTTDGALFSMSLVQNMYQLTKDVIAVQKLQSKTEENNEKKSEATRKELNELNATMQSLLEENKRLKQQTDDDREISFSAYPSTTLTNQGENAKVVFDSVLVNEGNGYSAKTGTFVCPVSGNYMIIVDVLTKEGKLWWNIKVNDVIKGHVYCNHSDGKWKPASKTIIVSLKKGDRVYIVNHNGKGYAYGGLYTGFSGTLLK